MNLTKEIKGLLKAHDLASVTDFINEDYEDDYLDNSDLDLSEIKELTVKYDGWGCDKLEENILSILKDELDE